MEPLAYPSFTCQSCGHQNTLEIDRTEGFPQRFVWDCERCCRPHDISVHQHADERLDVFAECI